MATTEQPVVQVEFPVEFQGLFAPKRYKVRYGGRGGVKSWSFARALVLLAQDRKLRILCARELQSSIKDSVHHLLVDQIDLLGLQPWFEVTERSIRNLLTGSEFIFKGLHHNINEIKSTEAIDICWVEEAQMVSKESWELLIPTVARANGPFGQGPEIWVSFNPGEEKDDTWQRFVVNTPPDCDILKINFDSNPWLPEQMEKERRYMLQIDPEAYRHIWLGFPRQIGSSVIFKGRYTVHNFDTPKDPIPTFHHGLDFGFANDPMAFGRNYITGEPPEEELWIDREVFGFGIEIDDYEEWMTGRNPKTGERSEFSKGIETSREWPIYADGARPESISYLRKRGFHIEAADKWPGSVEDGIAHLKAFKMIHIHADNCPLAAQEFSLYSFKVDRITQEVLPIIVDKHNHYIDGLRYSHNKYIQARGNVAMWERLAQ